MGGEEQKGRDQAGHWGSQGGGSTTAPRLAWPQGPQLRCRVERPHQAPASGARGAVPWGEDAGTQPLVLALKGLLG